MAMNLIVRVKRQFESGTTVSAQFEFDLDKHSTYAIMGRSGVGKTTLLRCIAGLEIPNEGVIQFQDQVWFCSERRINRSPQERRVGYISQESSLFPHLDVRENIFYGIRRLPKNQREARLAEVAELLDIQELMKRYPSELSGGQIQRIALARAWVTYPKLFLFDEPLSAIDSESRGMVLDRMKMMIHRQKPLTLWVTHDQREANQIAQEVVKLAYS